MNVYIEKCPVCAATKKSLAFSCKDHYATGETFEVYRCEACDFLFTQNFPDENNIARYYDTPDYVSHSNTQKGAINRIYHLVRKAMLRHKGKLVQKHTQRLSADLLDIGCGTGFFLDEMARRGWFVKGIEKNASACEFAVKNFGIAPDSPEMLDKYEERSFDVITLWHVLEHLQSLNETLQCINRLLVLNGTLIVAVPNAVSFDAEHYGEFWAAFDVPRHLWHFSPKTMKIIVEKAGFNIEKIYPMPFDAFYVSILSEKYKGSKCAFVKGLWQGLKVYFKSCGKPEKSSSVIYILKKMEKLNFKLEK